MDGLHAVVWALFLTRILSINSYKIIFYLQFFFLAFCVAAVPDTKHTFPLSTASPLLQNKNKETQCRRFFGFVCFLFVDLTLSEFGSKHKQEVSGKRLSLNVFLRLVAFGGLWSYFWEGFLRQEGAAGWWMLCQDLVTWTVKGPLCRSVVIFDPHLLRVDASGQRADPQDACFKALKCQIRPSDGFILPRQHDSEPS